MIHCNRVKENTSLQIVIESVEGVSAGYKNRGDIVRKVYRTKRGQDNYNASLFFRSGLLLLVFRLRGSQLT